MDLYTPKYEDLWFRKQFMSDSATMSFNHAWGGTIEFPESHWADWLERWVTDSDGKRFYRYLRNADKEFVGEIAYYDTGDVYMANIILYAKYRGKGYGREGLRLLCEEAKKHHIPALYDEIAIDNPAISLFLKMGFVEVERTTEGILLRKDLSR